MIKDLYVVATPIGNLEDMTFRAIRILKEVDFVMAEDTRQARKLFDKYEITTPLVSYHAQTSPHKAQQYVDRILKGESSALISDAGTPGISDPGFRLLNLVVKTPIKVIPIPGASAVTTLVSVAGIPVNHFEFYGFLPHKKGRQTLIKSFESKKEHAHIIYESVHRFPKLLKELNEFVGPNRTICVGRELTKMFEDIFRGTVEEALEYFTDQNTRGEFVVIIAPEKFSLN